MVSSSNDEGTKMLQDAAPVVIVPELRPYRSRGELVDLGAGPDDHRASSRSMLAKRKYVAIGEFHIYGADADLPNMRSVVELAKQHGLFLHSHSDADAVERHFQQDPNARVLWAHSGFERPEKVREMLRKHPQPVVRSRLPHRARLERQGGAGLARGLPRIPRPLHGRHRHLHARALALRRRACALVAPVARRPAARRGARRSPARTASACSAASSAAAMRLLAALIALLIAVPAWADCPLDLGRGTGSSVLRATTWWPSGPSRCASRSAQPFSLLFNVCTKNDKPAELVAVDAQMPEHKHGMNYRPTIVSLGDGRYRVDGMVFHMPGRWELAFDVRAGEESERLSHEFVVK